MAANKNLKTASLKAAKQLTSQEGSSSYTGSVGKNKAERLYRLNISRSSNLGLSITGLKADANLELLNGKGKVLNRSTQKGRLSESITQTVSEGIYFVRVSRRRGKTHYKLSLSVDALDNMNVAPADSLIQQVVDLTNVHRQAAGLQPLRLNAKLTAAAQAHSVDMAMNDFFSHTGSDQSTIFDRVGRTGYDYILATENIAAGYATPRSVVQAWMNSPGHRANILYPGLQEIGIGFYFTPNDTGTTNYQYYWTQDFGRPK
jgi:uncharacterized protein YkwD